MSVGEDLMIQRDAHGYIDKLDLAQCLNAHFGRVDHPEEEMVN